MAAEVTAKTNAEVAPIGGATNKGIKMAYITYTKANATDYFTCGFAKEVLLVVGARLNATGADDPATVSTNVITFTTGTGASRALIVYK